MSHIRFDLQALQNSTDCLKKAAYKTDLEVIKIDNVKYIRLRKSCRFFLLGRLISYIRYWLCSTDNINKQIKEIAEAHKTYATAAINSLFNANVPENKFLDIQRYVGIVDGLLSQSGFVEPISFEKAFVERFRRLFPEKTIAQLAEAAAANQRSPEQIALIAKSQKIIRITDLFKINCVEVNKVKTALFTPKINPALQGKGSLSDRQVAFFKAKEEEEVEVEGIAVETAAAENVEIEKMAIEKVEGVVRQLLNQEIKNDQEMKEVQEEIEEVQKQLKNLKSTISFSALFQEWIDAHFTQADIDGIKNAFSTAKFSKKLNAKIKKLDAYSLMKQLDKDYVYPPFEEIETIRSAYQQLKEILKDYQNFTPNQYIKRINQLFKNFSETQTCPDLKTFIPPKFLKMVEEIERKVEESTWAFLPAIKKQHDKFVEFATFYKGLRSLENISLADAQKQSTCQIKISVGITTDRNLGDDLKKLIYGNYNQSFGYWKVGDHHQLKCTFQFAEKYEEKDGQVVKKEDSAIYDLLLAPIYYGAGRPEIGNLNDDISDYIGTSYLREHKLKRDGFATILLICSPGRFDSPEWFRGKEHYPEGLKGQVRDRTIFMSCTTDAKDPHWLNDTTFKEKIKQILIKKACIEKAKTLLK